MRPDETTLRKLFARSDITGLGVVLGSVSGGLAVRDFDTVAPYYGWSASNPDDATRLPTVRTAQGFTSTAGSATRRLPISAMVSSRRLETLCSPPAIAPPGRAGLHVGESPAGSFGPLPLLPLSLMAGSRIPQTQPTHQTHPTQQPKQHFACVPQATVDAIEATLPDAPGQRNRKVFDLVRRLKGIAGLHTSPMSLEAIVVEWHRRALSVIRTKDFAETWSDFQIAWQRVRRPNGTSVSAAYKAARRSIMRSIDGSEDLGVLAAMCQLLGEAAGGGRFYLSCRTVSELFGVGRMTAWRWPGAPVPQSSRGSRNRRHEGSASNHVAFQLNSAGRLTAHGQHHHHPTSRGRSNSR